MGMPVVIKSHPSSHSASIGLNNTGSRGTVTLLEDSAHQIRLIEILPVDGEAAASSQICCCLTTVSLDDRHFTRDYQAYLASHGGIKGRAKFLKWQEQSQAKRQDGFEDWVYVADHADDDATTQLPDFRYDWGDYLALSYTWGDPSVTREIVVNGQAMVVTANIEACLRVLRDKSYIKEGWKLWIDALCINQRDIIERASQVKRMQEIYSKAWTPLIWLGPEADDSDHAFELIRILAEKYTSRSNVVSLTQDLNRNPELFGPGRWRALFLVAVRQYWRRAWILQEAAFGGEDMPVLCGSRTLPWIDVSKTFDLLKRTDEILNTYMTNELAERKIQFDVAIWANLATVCEIQILQDVRLGNCTSNFYRLLTLGLNVFATDSRDKIYGFLGLMDSTLADLIRPDYTDSIYNVYRDFAMATIEESNSLEVLRHTYLSPHQDWVPNWTLEPVTSTLTLSNTTFHASGDSTAEVEYLDNSKLLSCRGFVVDKFDGLGCMWAKGYSPDSVVPTSGSSNPYGSTAAIREAIWRALVANRSMSSEPIQGDYAALLTTPYLAEAKLREDDPLKELTRSNIFEWCVNFLKGNANLKVCGRKLSEYFDTAMPPEAIDPVQLRDGLMRRDQVNIRRRLVTTERGYVGMALENMEEGDVICILLGCTMPMVLRPLGAHYRVVGECYIHGIMEGAALEFLKTGECQLQELVLFGQGRLGTA